MEPAHQFCANSYLLCQGAEGRDARPGIPGRDGKDGTDFASVKIMESLISHTVQKGKL